MKIGCVIFSNDEKYYDLHQCAVNSFKSFHSDINLYSFDYKADFFKEIPNFASISQLPPGIQKYCIAYETAKKENLDKIIILGSDTITCDRLDEFINGEEDILATLDYPYQFFTVIQDANQLIEIKSPDSETHVNADVVCFNNIHALEKIILASSRHKVYFEQGGLNEVLWSGRYDFTFKIVDYPYIDSPVVYNVRSKGNICDNDGSKPWAQYTNKFYIENNKLYTGDNKLIKVFHYCEGFFTQPNIRTKNMINWWKETGFNEVTKKFFIEYCNCDFFK